MRRHQWISFLAAVVLVAGCAGPGGVRALADSSAESALAAHDITGTWQGLYWQLGMVYYLDDANCTLQIKDDSTFTAKCTRSPIGANNLAKSSSWSGHVVTRGNELVLDDDAGVWPSIVLRRSTDDRLYGTSLDPLVGATVQMKFEREAASASPTTQ
jgi:hypothetical protein